MPGTQNLELYTRLQKPFESEEEAKKSMNMFFKDVEAARERWLIADVHTIVMMNVQGENGLMRGMTSQHLGDSSRGRDMCAWAYGQEKEYHKRCLAALEEQGRQSV